MMRKLFLVAFLSAVSVPAMASCDALKSEIEAKLQANGVKTFTLDVRPVQAASAVAAAPAAASGVPAAKKGGKVVGNCDGGTKEIVYTRG